MILTLLRRILFEHSCLPKIPRADTVIQESFIVVQETMLGLVHIFNQGKFITGVIIMPSTTTFVTFIELVFLLYRSVFDIQYVVLCVSFIV
jgi:hypothetical protein